MKKDFEPVEARVNAKINIGLQIVHKRPDGYHDLQTVFYPTDFFTDYLRISPSEEEIVFNMESREDLGDADNNLCVKAFRLLQKDFGISNVEIFLRKGILPEPVWVVVPLTLRLRSKCWWISSSCLYLKIKWWNMPYSWAVMFRFSCTTNRCTLQDAAKCLLPLIWICLPTG